MRNLAEVARFLGKRDDVVRLDAWADRIARRFNEEFFDAASGIYHGENPTPYRQAANVVPLEYGLVPEADSARVLGSLLRDLDGTRDRIGTGFVGTLSMMELMPRIDPERPTVWRRSPTIRAGDSWL